MSDVKRGSGTVSVEVPDAAVKVLHYSAAAKGETLSDFLRTHGVPLNTRCGGRGLCESCTVELMSGAVGRDGATVCGSAGAGGGVGVKACVEIGRAHV